MTFSEAVVIGASGGIGAALADALAEEGVAVTRLARSASGAAHIDLTDESSIAAAAAAVGSPDLVVVATGLLHEGEGGRGPEKAIADLDPDWLARVAAHRARRPASWSTQESGDLVAALAPGRPVLVDCLGTWLTGLVDTAGAWEWPVERLESLVAAELDRLLPALTAATADVVLVTNEVGWGVVPSHRSGRVFRDLLGTVNQRVASACDRVHLVVAGRVLVL